MLSKSTQYPFARFAIIGLCCFFLFFSSCTPDSAEKDDQNSQTPTAFVYTANLNGVSWKATINVSTLVKDVSPKRMDLNAQSASGQRLLVSITDTASPKGNGISAKMYTLTRTGGDANFSSDINGNNLYQAAYGTVTITKCDTTTKKVSGTFSCTLYRASGDSLKVTQGVITNLPYSVFE